MDEAVKQGHYARKQMFCKSGLIAWSHRRRFETGLALVRAGAVQRILDYGCGDGTFLALLLDAPDPPPSAVGAELDLRLVADCQQRLGQRPGLKFVPLGQLDGAEHAGKYDAIICMEVLEHVVQLDQVFAQFHRLLAPAGLLFISVPVETGLPLLIKQAGRTFAGWRGLGDYPGTSPYTFGELFRGLLAGSEPHLPRPRHGEPDGFEFHDHKGFNWRAMRARVAAHFELLKTFTSPISWLPPGLASQVWFLARQRP